MSTPLTSAAQLLETARFAAAHARLYTDDPASAPWLVTGAALMAQQAAAMALKAAGDTIPAQAGATELLLRAAHKDRLPPPYTLAFGTAARQAFDRLVEARNGFMHPRGVGWFVSDQTLARGLPIACRVARQLLITQPAAPDLLTPRDRSALETHLRDIDALAAFLADTP